MKDWMLYIEDDKVKAFDITAHDNDRELQVLCKESGIPILGYVGYDREKDAINYGERGLR